MFTNNMRPVHPGEVLREDYLAELGMSANALAKSLRVPAPRVNDIVRERRGISADTALRLARYFDTTPRFWLNLQTAYDDGTCRAAVPPPNAGDWSMDIGVPQGNYAYVEVAPAAVDGNTAGGEYQVVPGAVRDVVRVWQQSLPVFLDPSAVIFWVDRC